MLCTRLHRDASQIFHLATLFQEFHRCSGTSLRRPRSYKGSGGGFLETLCWRVGCRGEEGGLGAPGSRGREVVMEQEVAVRAEGSMCSC